MDRLTDGAASANRDLHDTTGDILSQLDSVRSAIIDLGSTPEKTVDDVSDSVEQEGEQGRVISCANHGEVTGDANVGGVAGILATELGLDPEEDLDIQNDKLLSDTTAYIKATVRDCRNAGAVTAKNDCAGGIIGRGEVGAVLDCRNTGDVETTSGGQCGGVAGLSRTVIRRSYALCSLTGNDKVGGVAGEGHDIRECYTMVSVTGGGERFGAVAGMADGEVERNYFVRESLAGIDGVDYAGKAEPMDYEDFAAVPGMPEEFLGFRITFLVDGAAIKTLAVPYGGDLDPESIPEVPRREGVYGAWEDFSQENITRSRTVEAVYSDWITTISTGEEQPCCCWRERLPPEPGWRRRTGRRERANFWRDIGWRLDIPSRWRTGGRQSPKAVIPSVSGSRTPRERCAWPSGRTARCGSRRPGKRGATSAFLWSARAPLRC